MMSNFFSRNYTYVNVRGSSNLKSFECTICDKLRVCKCKIKHFNGCHNMYKRIKRKREKKNTIDTKANLTPNFTCVN